MAENLVIVESPAKAKTIEKFLGKEFTVVSSYGHIRDLAKKNLGIDIENNYTPEYIVPDDKKKVVTDLKKQVKNAETVWLASDEDREGEAIAWHLYEVLGLQKKDTKRIVFHEITKTAIQDAIKKPRSINFDLVKAQQARRVLDRLVGFELSPVLWKKVKPSLSAGRVQSVAVRLIVEREREILNFKPTSSFKVHGDFNSSKGTLNATLSEKINAKKDVKAFLENCIDATFKIADITKKPSKKSPAAPFTTSTLQQEASRKLGFSVSQTMAVAQRLYESGKITYMRTDSVNLAESALKTAESAIKKNFGDDYHHRRTYTTKSKGAQEAHEAIRPTFLENDSVSGSNQEQKLYDLIWKRTIASQMSDAKLEKTTITIDISSDKRDFIATGEVLIFDGFLKVYIESTDDESDEEVKGLLPTVKANEPLEMEEIRAIERYTHHPPRYTEASLVRKLEELGIGRPSTYAPTISTIQNRGYVVKEDRPGVERSYDMLKLENTGVQEKKLTEITGAEKNKLFPINIGMVVNDFLVDNFKEILDYNFTATVEKEFDEIALGNMDWSKMIDSFYNPFHKNVEETTEHSERQKGERYLGDDPKTGKPVIVRIGRYGPMAQMGESDNENEKPKFAGIPKGKLMETITLEEALDLFKLPRELGDYEDKQMVVAIGRFGPYVKHDNKFFSLKKEDDPFTITKDRAIEIIEAKREQERNKFIKTFKEDETLQVLNGRYGPYISFGKKNYRIPKNTDPKSLDYEQCLEIIKKGDEKKSAKGTTKGRKKK
ncbi:MAG: type I DNA topoisomerase [Bacteroidetes bacterium]|jgi:DNA topoisomerase-1|nr:type I DNA topoisomerase [Bacteroidota bacterium]